MQKVGIIGIGRFGKTLIRLLKDDFELVLYDKNVSAFETLELPSSCRISKNSRELFTLCSTIFYCVPISTFEKVLQSHKKNISNHLLIDVLSVKEYARKVFNRQLKGTKSRFILTHPMFGPNSSVNGFNNLPLVMEKGTATNVEYVFWKKVFIEKGLRIVEISATEHDKLAANSQGVTHFVGRLLGEFNFQKTKINTLGATKLFEVREQTCNDSWELFMNLQNYNTFTRSMRIRLGKAYERLYNKLIPDRINGNKITFGIQGGKGSFNEEAVRFYISTHGIAKYRIKYLYTTERVLQELHKGTIDYGQFAIHNSIGGIVRESIEGMSKYRFRIVEEFFIPIRHVFMKRKDVPLSEVKTLMAHPQVFKQCVTTLRSKYPLLLQKTGDGDLQDTARIAYCVATGKLDKHIGIVGPKKLAELYDFDVIAENLQDDKTNMTAFLMVKRR